MPGVRAIVTAQDAPGLFGIGIADQPLFARDIVRYHGEPLAAIAADTLRQAKAAAAAIDVSLEVLPLVLTMADALSPDAPLVNPDWKNYEILLEAEGARRGGNIAWRLLSAGEISTPQFPEAPSLSLKASIRWVTTPAVGGGFGVKYGCSVEPYAAAPARATGRTVALINSREDEAQTCLCRENAEIHIRSAVTKHGEIVGREATVLMDCGVYGGEQIYLMTMTAHTPGSAYRPGAVKMTSRAVIDVEIGDGARVDVDTPEHIVAAGGVVSQP